MRKPHLLLLLCFTFNLLKAQNVYIIGKLNETGKAELGNFIKRIDGHFKYKKVKFIFANDQDFFIYKKKKQGSYIELDARIDKHIMLNKNITRQEIEASKRSIPMSSYTRMIYDRSVSESKYSFANLSTLTERLEYFNPKEKLDFLLVFIPIPPVVQINTPNETEPFNLLVAGVVKGDTKSSVQLKLNNRPWFNIEAKENWTHYLTFNEAYKERLWNISARAYNEYGDTSSVAELNKINYLPFNSKAVTYLSPTNLKNEVPQCKEYKFVFRFMVDKGLDLSRLSLVVEDKLNNIIHDKNVTLFQESSSRYKIRDQQIEVCLFITYSAFGFRSPCLIPDDTPFHYYLRYNSLEGNTIKSSPVMIYFSSFDDDYLLQYPDCDCE